MSTVMDPELERMFDDVQAEIAEDAKESGAALPTWSTTRRRAALAWVAVAIVVAWWVLRPRADFGVYPGTRMGTELGVLAAATAISIWGATRSIAAARRPWQRWLVVLGPLAFVFGVLVAPAHTAHPASLEGVGADFGRRAIGCLSTGFFSAFPLFLLTRRFDRGDDPGFGAISAVVLAWLTSTALLQVHCPITHPVHLWAGHAAVVVPLVAVWFAFARARPRGRAIAPAAPGDAAAPAS